MLVGAVGISVNYGVDCGLTHGHGDVGDGVLVEPGAFGEFLGGSLNRVDTFDRGTERERYAACGGIRQYWVPLEHNQGNCVPAINLCKVAAPWGRVDLNASIPDFAVGRHSRTAGVGFTALKAVCLLVSRKSRVSGEKNWRWVSKWVTGGAKAFRSGWRRAGWDRMRERGLCLGKTRATCAV